MTPPTVTVDREGTVTGNTYDKYGSTNPVVLCHMASFEGTLDDSRRQAESVGINAIPAHIFGQRYLVVGAHPYENFKQVLDRLREDETSS